jgi:hypothetical protein
MGKGGFGVYAGSTLRGAGAAACQWVLLTGPWFMCIRAESLFFYFFYFSFSFETKGRWGKHPTGSIHDVMGAPYDPLCVSTECTWARVCEAHFARELG